MDTKQFHFRVRITLLILAALLSGFFYVLYSLQIVHGADYKAQSIRKITKTETVEAARGQILDRYGRVLVSNRISYQVALDTSLMGKEETRNPILLSLLAICREESVSWTDQVLPISMAAPFTFTDTLSDAARSRYETFLERMKWTTAAAQGPDALLSEMRKFYNVADSVSPEDGRALVGVLCELRIRSMDILRTSYVFAQDVDIDFISRVKEAGLTGVSINPTTVRQYDTPYAAHLLGRVGLMDPDEWETYQNKGYGMSDTVGKDGVELAFEEYLRGEAGERAIDTNTSGKIVDQYWLTDLKTGETLEPKPGDNVSLTLDIRLQEAVERALADVIPTLPSKDTRGGAAAVVDVKTGGVLSLASYPTFDLANIYTDPALYNAALSDPLKPFLNRATLGAYSPGSTFKMVVGTAALQEGLVTPAEKILDTGRLMLPEEKKYPYGDYHPMCWAYRQHSYTHGLENMADAIRDSCNIYFYTIGHRLGIDRINQYASMFGLGKKTGLELPEAAGRVASPATSEKLGVTWYGGDLLSASIGQGNTLATPLQLANYIATLVNGGSHYSAHLLQNVKSSDFSQVIYQRESELVDTLNISKENLDAVKRGMWEVANDPKGSAYKYFKDFPVTVGCKTGTAQVASTSEANAVFVCFAPYDNPEIAVSIVVERGGSGSELAAVAADILSYYFNTERTMEAVGGENTLSR